MRPQSIKARNEKIRPDQKFRKRRRVHPSGSGGNLTGQRFGKLIALEPVGGQWRVLCDCGTHARKYESVLLRLGDQAACPNCLSKSAQKWALKKKSKAEAAAEAAAHNFTKRVQLPEALTFAERLNGIFWIHELRRFGVEINPAVIDQIRTLLVIDRNSHTPRLLCHGGDNIS